MPENKEARAHTIYKLADGKRCPGVTTVLNENLGWNKNALIGWSRREALAGNDPDKIRDATADIGTCAHYLCECDAKNVEPDLSSYSEAHIKIAENCFIGYLDWKKESGIKEINPELICVSEKYQYGGMIDMLCVGDKVILGDIKTSKDIFVEHKIQVAAYYYLLIENDYKIDEVGILHLGKNGDFAYHKITNLDIYFDIFKHCLELRKLHKLC